MKRLSINLVYILIVSSVLNLLGCKEDSLNTEPAIITSFTVKGKDGSVFRSVINTDQTITIKVSPYLNADTVLADAICTFFLSKGATVYPDPKTPQNFAQEGGVKYTVTAEDGVTKKDYIVSWGASDLLADGAGFSYAEIGSSKDFTQLGYPGQFNNFDLPDSKQYGDLNMYMAYCGESIILLSRSYIDTDPNSQYGIKVIHKNSSADAGKLNLGSYSMSDLKAITTDYEGHAVGLIINNGTTEVIYWTNTTTAPISSGKIAINMASFSDGANNFQVAGDITGQAWITSLAPRTSSGEHYRLQVSNGKLASTHSKVTTGYSSTDCTGFQMISPLNDSDQPTFIVGDSEGAVNTANSIKVCLNSFAGSKTTVMPSFWQNILQTWWSGTGFTTALYGGRAPVVSGMVINGKSYAFISSGTSWWHAAAVVSADLQTLAHENLNIAASINRSWSNGSWATWYYDKENKEGHLAVWFERIGLKTYKLTCFE